MNSELAQIANVVWSLDSRKAPGFDTADEEQPHEPPILPTELTSAMPVAVAMLVKKAEGAARRIASTLKDATGNFKNGLTPTGLMLLALVVTAVGVQTARCQAAVVGPLDDIVLSALNVPAASIEYAIRTRAQGGK
jgi:hypothetical protein